MVGKYIGAYKGLSKPEQLYPLLFDKQKKKAKIDWKQAEEIWKKRDREKGRV